MQYIFNYKIIEDSIIEEIFVPSIFTQTLKVMAAQRVTDTLQKSSRLIFASKAANDVESDEDGA